MLPPPAFSSHQDDAAHPEGIFKVVPLSTGAGIGEELGTWRSWLVLFSCSNHVIILDSCGKSCVKIVLMGLRRWLSG